MLVALVVIALAVIVFVSPLSASGIVVALCWGSAVIVWVVGAIYNARRSGRVKTRSPMNKWVGVSAVAAVLVIVFLPVDWNRTNSAPAWFRSLGGIVLVTSTAFSIWSRVRLGRMWSSMAVQREDHQLRTDGPYAVTRHPIYTGMLGMILGTAVLTAEAAWVAALLAGAVILETKVLVEERLLLTVFPEEYERYRKRVPQLVPIPRRTRLPHSK